MGGDQERPVSGVTMQLRRSLKEGCRKAKAWSVHTVHTPSVAFRHLLPNSGYATEGVLLIYLLLSTDAVSALRKLL